ncbi:agmatine ureohydrolase [Histoplasma capsulatum var. duboisii H88]|uniref:Agmatine ureohydrolase n=1 Tax=Ajellomyces capsulatus (strain H88) TaxID=544711 RepID=F0U8I1_AJEC8|nr:agmatine ureohydrolase [Histoplasma capsulatum var. duboisii H88]
MAMLCVRGFKCFSALDGKSSNRRWCLPLPPASNPEAWRHCKFFQVAVRHSLQGKHRITIFAAQERGKMLLRSWASILGGFLLYYVNPIYTHDGHDYSNHEKSSIDRREELLEKWDQEHVKCLLEPDEHYDIAILGAPFDTSVSFRPGARFGPRAIPAASARQLPANSYNTRAAINPYLNWARILDCGDIPIMPFDNGVAERQMYEAFLELGTREAPNAIPGISHGKPKIVTLGGDHSITLPALRALHKIYGKPITVFFHTASREGLISNTSSAHAGLCTRLTGLDDGDYSNPGPEQGFLRIHADEIDDVGPNGIINTIISRIGLSPEDPVYLSLDIDVLDPGIAPGTGTPEPGGWTTRELIRILRGIEKLNFVGADIVEVSPSYDTGGETTALAAAQVAFEIITSMVKLGVKEEVGGWYGKKEEAGKKKRDEL